MSESENTEYIAPAENTAMYRQDRMPKKESWISAMFDYVEILVFSVCAVLLIFTLCGRLCRVDGSSMMKTLKDQELLVTTSLKTPEQGDIVVFHLTGDEPGDLNKPLVKRVIATEGQTVRIDYNEGEVYIDGVLLDEPYIALLDYEGKEIGEWRNKPVGGVFETTVPAGCYFVMGDNRNNSADSRSSKVGCVDGRRILGVAVLRLKPFTIYN